MDVIKNIQLAGTLVKRCPHLLGRIHGGQLLHIALLMLRQNEGPVLVWPVHIFLLLKTVARTVHPLSSSFAPLIITMATRGRHQTVNIE